MVFCHGGEGTRIHWWHQVAFFQRHYRCLTYDARGFGASPAGAPSPSDNPLRDDLVGLLDHVGIDRAIVIGHSMGGLAASGVAQAHPARVHRLVMSDSPFNFATAALAEWSRQMIDKIHGGFRVLDHLYAPGFDEREFGTSYLYRALNRLNRPVEGPTGMEAYEAWRDQPEGDYRSFAVPTLFIVGAEDELTLPWLMRATAEAVNGALLVEIEGAGHSGYAERPDVFNAAVHRFVTAG